MQWKLPDLGEGVLEGEIVKWLVKEGDQVAVDQHIVEIMTDKATMELPSPIAGKVHTILAKEGVVARVGQTLAEIGEEEKRVTEAGLSPPSKIESPLESVGSSRAGMGPASGRTRFSSTTKPQASPAVRALARHKGVDLKTVASSGPQGRVTQADVERAARGLTSVAGAEPVNAPIAHKPPILREGDETIVPLRGLRRKIAEHMTVSRKIAAHFTHADEADLTALMALRESAKKSAEQKGVKLTILAYFVKAVAATLKKFPTLNASLDDEKQEILLKNHYHIGIASATESGLIVPVIKNADQLSLLEVAKEITRLSDLARQGKIGLEDLKGGTFTITNVGSIGGILSAPIINYPEVAIMGLHKLQEKPVVRDGKIVIRKMMNISISADHRVVDGAEVAKFLNEVIAILENPNEKL